MCLSLNEKKKGTIQQIDILPARAHLAPTRPRKPRRSKEKKKKKKKERKKKKNCTHTCRAGAPARRTRREDRVWTAAGRRRRTETTTGAARRAQCASGASRQGGTPSFAAIRLSSPAVPRSFFLFFCFFFVIFGNFSDGNLTKLETQTQTVTRISTFFFCLFVCFFHFPLSIFYK
jgi:hypothetical protein